MKIFIVGLGLIGASYAQGLKKAGHEIYASNRTEAVVEQAIKEKIVEKDNDMSYLSKVDLIILGLYPKHNIEFLSKHKHLLKKGQIITDVSGTKAWMTKEIEALIPDGVSYTSHHPMAGKESSGYASKDYKIFKDANFIIVKGQKSGPKDEKILKNIASDLKFGKITITDAQTHDELIAFTSQLTHVIAVSLVHSDHLKETPQATGDSYRDLTRIAKINEVMWTELFLENKEALLKKINDFEKELDQLKKHIETNDKESIQEYLKSAKEKRKVFDET
ncbi:prephenate dehydrogenase [Mariniplasma anaerobium]|uniref:Prephenate dehydrogenase n=1 Tax=Mariniplasma anaerobium TaxID=2735436 RepID=A0A7U9TIW9_9MOLU|nr:prephenate dehydrogenase [Mariniplasma anaerobium]BCR35478.1 prephenate dehydrogenase [Mariniplasma anaerobium]